MRVCITKDEKECNALEKWGALEKLLKLTKGRCILSLKEGTKYDVIEYHHLEKAKEDGEITYYNGAPLLSSIHDVLHVIEWQNKGLYCKINNVMDCYKGALELQDVLNYLYSDQNMNGQNDILNSSEAGYFESMDSVNNCFPVDELSSHYDSMDLSEDDCFYNIDDPTVEEFSLHQLIMVRDAIRIFEMEVEPALLVVFNRYKNGQINDEPIKYIDFDKIREARQKRKQKKIEKRARIEQKNKNT